MRNVCISASALVVFGFAGLVTSALLADERATPGAGPYLVAMHVGGAVRSGSLAIQELTCRNVYRIGALSLGHQCRRDGLSTAALTD